MFEVFGLFLDFVQQQHLGARDLKIIVAIMYIIKIMYE